MKLYLVFQEFRLTKSFLIHGVFSTPEKAGEIVKKYSKPGSREMSVAWAAEIKEIKVDEETEVMVGE